MRSGRAVSRPSLVGAGDQGDGSGGDELLDDTSIAWWGADGPGFDRRTPTVIVSHTTPDDVPAGGVYTFVRSPREAAEVAIRLAGGKGVDLFSASIGGQLLRAGLVDEVRIHLAPVLLGAGTACSTTTTATSACNRPASPRAARRPTFATGC